MYCGRKKNRVKVNLRLKKDYLNYIFLILIILLSFVSDKVFLKDNLSLPAWDQGYHLTNLFKTIIFLVNLIYLTRTGGKIYGK